MPKLGGEDTEKEARAYYAALDKALDRAMTGPIAELVKAEMNNSAKENVYAAYEPRFYSRRGEHYGGISDPRTMDVCYDGRMPDVKVLEVSANADWQQLRGGRKPNSMLADAIENGESRFNMARAGERHFTEPAERHLIDSGLLDAMLEACLEEELGNLIL